MVAFKLTENLLQNMLGSSSSPPRLVRKHFNKTHSQATLECQQMSFLGLETLDHLEGDSCLPSPSKIQPVTLCSNILSECPLFTACVLKISTVFLKNKEKLKQTGTFATADS